MAGESGKKLFVGPRFRRIRQQLGLSQTQIAEGLGISPSYINLIERNQRPVTAQLLLRLARDLRPRSARSRHRRRGSLLRRAERDLLRSAVPADRPAEAGAARSRRTVPRRHAFAAAALRRLYRSPARRDPGGRANRRPRRRRALRGQPDRARARPDRGQPQLFSRTRSRPRKACATKSTCRRRICSRRSARGCAKNIPSSPASCRSM